MTAEIKHLMSKKNPDQKYFLIFEKFDFEKIIIEFFENLDKKSIIFNRKTICSYLKLCHNFRKNREIFLQNRFSPKIKIIFGPDFF